MARLEIQLLGPPGIRVNGIAVAGLPAKLEALLYYLATAPRSVTRSALAGLLWSERSEQDARMNLRAALQKIPSDLAPCVTVARDFLAIDSGAALDVDTRKFEAIVETLASRAGDAQRLARLREAAALYRGDFLHGFAPGQAPEFESWTQAERARLRQGAVRLHTEVLALEREAKLDADAAQTARRILQLSPGNDPALRELMTSLARSGQRNAALEEFERHRKLWHDELGIAPDSETVRVAERIVSGEAASAVPVPAASPIAAQLFGREAEFALVGRLLAAGESRIVSITGLGGIGKTRLAQMLMAELKGSHRDGAVLVSAGAMRNGASLAPALGTALGMQLRAGDVTAQLKDFLREKSLLVVVDSFEALNGTQAVDLLIELAREAPGLRVLVTSREALGVEEEAVVALDGLPYPTEAAAGSPGWRDYPAVQLFIQRAARGYVQFDAEREREGITRLCRRVQGIPLAIELAASLARSMPCVEIARALERDLQSLAKDDAGLSPRHRSLAGVLDTAFAQLTPELQACVARLSAFLGPFRADAAEAVAECSLRQLSTLIEKSWLRRDAGGYLLHDVVRQYCATRMVALKLDRTALAEAHAAFFNHWLAAHEHAMRMVLGSVLDDVTAGLADFTVAVEAAAEHGKDGDSLAALRAMFYYLEGRGDFVTARLFFENAALLAARNKRGRRAMLPIIDGCIGWALVQMSQYEEAMPILERSVKGAREAGDDFARAMSLRAIALAAVMLGRPGTAAQFEECMAVTRTLDDPLTMIATLNVMGVAASYHGDARDPADYYRQMLTLSEQLGYTRGQMVANFNLGDATINQGRYDEAHAHFMESLRLGNAAGNRRNQVMSLSNLAMIAQLRHDAASARAHLDEAWRIARELGDRRAFCFLQEGETELFELLEDWPAMLESALAHVERATAITWTWSLAFAFCLQAQALTRLGRADESMDALRAMRESIRAANWPAHDCGFALESARWLCHFGDAPGRELGERAMKTLATSDTVDSWSGERARKVAFPAGVAPLEGTIADWAAQLEEALPRATIAG